MTLLAGSWIQRFLFGKAVPCMALVTGVVLIQVALSSLFFLLGLGLNPHVVTTAAASASFH
jgi:hypothetical protein